MPSSPQTTAAQHRITRLATHLPVHRAFHWLHLHQPQIRQWQLEFLHIPAPPFGERARAEWFLARFDALGLSNCRLDSEGNALGELAPDPTKPVLLLSAHLDTVFAAGTPTTPIEDPDSARILGPGACDNGAGLAALLAIAAALKHAGITPPVPILFAANVGEEGEGDLRGMRHLFEHGSYAGRIAAALPLEGSGTSAAVNRGLGSRRFRVTVTGPGGHSWADAETPNPLVIIARALAELVELPGLVPSRTTLSPSLISGGTSINSIPEAGSVSLDLRSTEPGELERIEGEIRRIFREQTARMPGARVEVAVIGNRPAAALPELSLLLFALRAVDRHLGLRTELRLGSTDANIPLALGIPSLALAAGGTGGGIHTLAEWFDPTGRETALRRILLLLLDVAGTLGADGS